MEQQRKTTGPRGVDTAPPPGVTADGRTADPDWRRRARCAAHYPGAFFAPPGAESAQERAVRETLAAAVCRDCPVVQACLDLAEELGQPDGVWGGLNERQRRRRAGRVLHPA